MLIIPKFSTEKPLNKYNMTDGNDAHGFIPKVAPIKTKIEIELSEWESSYLWSLANEFKCTPSEVLSGLIAGFCLKRIVKDLKGSHKQKKDKKNKKKWDLLKK